jgi:hypothetical protein
MRIYYYGKLISETAPAVHIKDVLEDRFGHLQGERGSDVPEEVETPTKFRIWHYQLSS